MLKLRFAWKKSQEGKFLKNITYNYYDDLAQR